MLFVYSAPILPNLFKDLQELIDTQRTTAVNIPPTESGGTEADYSRFRFVDLRAVTARKHLDCCRGSHISPVERVSVRPRLREAEFRAPIVFWHASGHGGAQEVLSKLKFCVDPRTYTCY